MNAWQFFKLFVSNALPHLLRQLSWYCGGLQPNSARIPKQVLYGELVNGSRSRGGQKKRYKDSLKVSTKLFHIEPDTWEDLALDRSAWRSSVKRGAKLHEENRISLAKQKRAKRKERSREASAAAHPECGRTFHARNGLVSHLRTHNTQRRNQQR